MAGGAAADRDDERGDGEHRGGLSPTQKASHRSFLVWLDDQC
jgi:hypothetical protein